MILDILGVVLTVVGIGFGCLAGVFTLAERLDNKESKERMM